MKEYLGLGGEDIIIGMLYLGYTDEEKKTRVNECLLKIGEMGEVRKTAGGEQHVGVLAFAAGKKKTKFL